MGATMKKNILTIIIMAITLINTVLLVLMIFTVIPAANKTSRLIDKVASIVDLELESPEDEGEDFTVSDIETYNIEEKLTINIKSTDGKNHYALMNVSLSMNSKNKDYETLSPKIQENENAIKEIVQEEFAKYTADEINTKKTEIKEQVIARIRELMQSDFIINVSFGSMTLN
jgi:flagellar basal body-associated protein FliL